MRIVIIKNGWFRAAGNVYRWRKDHHIFGVGIDIDLLETENKIGLKIEDKKYYLNCQKALDFIKKYNSFKTVGIGKVLGIVSRSILDPIESIKIGTYEINNPKNKLLF